MDQLLSTILDTSGDITISAKDDDGDYSVSFANSHSRYDVECCSKSPMDALMAALSYEISALAEKAGVS